MESQRGRFGEAGRGEAQAGSAAIPESRMFPVWEGVVGVDHHFQGHPHIIASFAITGPGGRFALIETGPESTLEGLEAGLAEAGLHLANLEAILVTHIHLDHAGAAGALARRAGCPIYVHEVGRPHLADPARLWASASRTFGPDTERLWKGITPAPESLLRPVAEGDRLEFFGRRIEVVYTPGHADHHVAYLLDGQVLFTGDAAGVRLPEFDYVRPPAVPPELHIERWDATIDRLRSLRPARLVLTHFGPYGGDLDAHLLSLQRRLHRWAEVVLQAMREGLPDEEAARRLAALEMEELPPLARDPAWLEVIELTTPRPVMLKGYQRYWQKVHPERLQAS